jgi:SEC-C motif
MAHDSTPIQREHHYVPRCYLAPWTTDGLLWRYVRGPQGQCYGKRVRRLVAELPQQADGPLDKGSAALLAQLHERPTRSRRTLRKLCEPVVPELSWLPTKVRPPLPDEAGLTDLRRGLATLPLPRPSEAKLVVRARAETAEHRSPSHVATTPLEVHGSAASWAKVGRNDPCPCGSGKKHKRCCG